MYLIIITGGKEEEEPLIKLSQRKCLFLVLYKDKTKMMINFRSIAHKQAFTPADVRRNIKSHTKPRNKFISLTTNAFYIYNNLFKPAVKTWQVKINVSRTFMDLKIKCRLIVTQKMPNTL